MCCVVWCGVVRKYKNSRNTGISQSMISFLARYGLPRTQNTSEFSRRFVFFSYIFPRFADVSRPRVLILTPKMFFFAQGPIPMVITMRWKEVPTNETPGFCSPPSPGADAIPQYQGSGRTRDTASTSSSPLDTSSSLLVGEALFRFSNQVMKLGENGTRPSASGASLGKSWPSVGTGKWGANQGPGKSKSTSSRAVSETIPC